MASLNEKLAASLKTLQAVQRDGIVRSSDLSRVHRDRLVKSGFLVEVINGWLLVTNPGAPDGASTSWYASFWSFIAQYLESRFGDSYCLAPEGSIKHHVGADLIPKQVIVIVKEPVSQTLPLCFDTSLYLYHTKDSFPENRVKINNLWLMELPAALCRVSPAFFKNDPTDAEIALRTIRDPSPLLHSLLEGGHGIVAGRLAGAYQYLGERQIAERIKETMDAAGSTVRVTNPFDRNEPLLRARTRIISPHAARIKSLWVGMRVDVQAVFSQFPARRVDPVEYLEKIEERYAVDAYNSLSIEGYRMTPELIERVRRGDWNPGAIEADSRESDTLAARGYYQAFQAVKASIRKILEGASVIEVVEGDFQRWYQEMFEPAVVAGLLNVSQLAGYRNSAVYLRGSRYVPPSPDAVQDCMEAFFELLAGEENAAVRAVLGHFIFVYIHPYNDGNGRIGRFLMNALLASGGYPWTVIRQMRRAQYLAALEDASTKHNAAAFARFVLEEMQAHVDFR